MQKEEGFRTSFHGSIGSWCTSFGSKNDSGGPSPDLDAFFHLTWHGAPDSGEGEDREIGYMLDIIRDIRGGQADMYFCSTACLRQFLNHCVDELERKVARMRSSNTR